VARSRAVPGQDQQFQAGVEFLPMPAETSSLAEVVAELDYCQKPPGDGRRMRESD
jgi:hypothetical protein